MNLPNKLTMLRIILIPVFLVLVLVDRIPMHYLWSLIVFLAACITDTQYCPQEKPRHRLRQADGPPGR